MDDNPRPLVVVQNNFVNKLTDPVARAVHLLDLKLWDVSSGEQAGKYPLPRVGEWSPILVFGSILFVEQWFENRPDLRKWGFWETSQFDAQLWAEKLGYVFLNADGYATTVGKFQTSDSLACHIRPRSEMKLVGDRVRTEDATGQRSVPGAVVTPEQVRILNIDPDTDIWVSPTKRIDAEIRIWIIGGKIATSSMYRYLGQMAHFEGLVVEAAEQCALAYHDIWHPAVHYVVDLALREDGSYQIIEYNPIHSSGWYAADPIDVIRAFFDYEKTKE